jgi:hypothetical protein
MPKKIAQPQSKGYATTETQTSLMSVKTYANT